MPAFRTVSARRGTALIICVAVLLVMGTLSAAFLDNGIHWIRSSNEDARLAKALYAAEAGVNRAYQDLQNSLGTGWDDLLKGQDGVGGTSDDGYTQMGQTVVLSTDTDPPTTFSVRVTDDADDADLYHDSNGTVIVNSTGTAEGRTNRLVRAYYGISVTPGFQIINAVTVNGDVTIDGNPEIQGLLANVYANGNMTINGNATIDLLALSAASVDIAGSPTINGVMLNTEEKRAAYEAEHSDWPQTPIPQVNADNFLARANFVKYRLVSSGANAGKIYTYNPDSVTDAAMTAGTWTNARKGNGERSLGWTWNDLNNTWEYESNNSHDGVFFAESDVEIKGSPGSSDTPWTASILSRGDIHVTGKPKIKAAAEILYVANEDIKVAGTATQYFEGVMLAHEQYALTGNPDVKGAVLAENAASVSTLVTTSSISGNVNLTYNGAVMIQEIQPAAGTQNTKFMFMLTQ